MCRKCKLIMFRGEGGLCMLTTGFNLCQGSSLMRGRKIPELAAGAQHVAAAALADEHIDAGLPHNRLKCQHITVRRTSKCAAWQRIDGDQIDLAGRSVEG